MNTKTVSEISEFQLIARIQNLIQERTLLHKPLLGIGDDAAAWIGKGKISLATTDSMIEGVHFLSSALWYDVGWKSLATNISDIAAMGGIPCYALVTLAIPPHLPLQSIEEFYRGLLDAAEQFRTAIIGGDIVSAPISMITISLLGEIDQQEPSGQPLLLRRDKACIGDTVAVTGTLGGSAAGLEIVLGKKQISSAEITSALLKKHFHPIPRVQEGCIAASLGVKTGMDISDGLAGDLHRICEQSHVGISIQSSLLPIPLEVKSSWEMTQATHFALYGGEDYELLLIAPHAIITQVQEAFETIHLAPLTPIGVVTEERGLVAIEDNGVKRKVEKKGWDHFPQPL